jgi:thioredoxin 1
VISLSTATWVDEVEKSSVPVLVEFGAEWCPPCKMIAPVLAELALEYRGRLKVGTLDVDANGPLAARFGVMGLPTMLLFKQGQPVGRIVGFVPKHELRSQIAPLLG